MAYSACYKNIPNFEKVLLFLTGEQDSSYFPRRCETILGAPYERWVGNRPDTSASWLPIHCKSGVLKRNGRDVRRGVFTADGMLTIDASGFRGVREENGRPGAVLTSEIRCHLLASVRRQARPRGTHS